MLRKYQWCRNVTIHCTGLRVRKNFRSMESVTRYSMFIFYFFISLSSSTASLRIPSDVNRVLLYSSVSLFLNPHTGGHHILYLEWVRWKKHQNWTNTTFLPAGSRPDRLPSQLPIPLHHFMTRCLIAGITLISYCRALLSMTLECAYKTNVQFSWTIVTKKFHRITHKVKQGHIHSIYRNIMQRN
jgi:hypothetical protein